MKVAYVAVNVGLKWWALQDSNLRPSDYESEPFTLNAEDRAHPVLQRRHGRAKPTTLQIASGAKGKDPHPALARTLAEAAVGLLSGDRRNIAVVVNRIATARLVASLLAEQSGKKKVPDFEVHLAIGRMRPLDRDQLTLSIQQRVGPDGNTQPEAPPMFVVATQCLEVGADFDFDGMVSECASIDALRQRFGRLNRRGRDVDARGVVVVREDQVNDADDPVYGTALSKTWEWLVSKKDADNGSIDFGVQAMDRLSEDTDTSELLAPRLDAPVMFPAYVDIWAQTSPMPVPDPEVALFIHGPRGGEPDVQVCWRKDLTEGAQDDWVQVVSMLPPTTPECMSVPISAARRWLQGDPVNDENQADLLENTADEENGHAGTARSAVLWRGTRDSLLVSGALELRPGDTVVLPVWAEGWDVLGHVPPHAPRDIADLACRRSTGIASLRMRPDTLDAWAESDSRVEIMTWLANPEQNLRAADLRALLRALAEDAPSACADIAEAMRLLAGNRLGFEYERYPDGRGAVFRTKRAEKRPALLPALDDGDDRGSVLPTSVALPEHLNHVADTLAETLPLLPVAPWAQALQCAASLHDIGKADERFQAMLRRGNINAAWALPVPLAKSGGVPMSLAEWQQAANRCGFPKGFRHEMLSVQLAECASALLPEDELQRDLALHLIAAHHGHGRPFAPVVLDEDPPPVDLKPAGIVASLTAEARKSFPSHRLDSGIAERFWKLTRRYGWWGLAYLEAVLRLVDQRASQRESEMAQPSESPQTVETTA